LIKIKPFKGLRPKKDLYQKIVAPPYDVVSYDDCMKIVKKEPLSLIHISRSEVDFPVETDHYSPEIYEKAKQNLLDYIKKGYLSYDEKECFYIYKQTMGSNTQIGFVGVVSAYDYDNGIVKKHENTRQDKEEDRIRHIDITNCQTEPVFLAYRSKDSLNKILFDTEKTPPEVDFTTEDGIGHSFWVIKDDDLIKTIVNEFSQIPYLYVADGHHRTAAAVNVAKRRDKATNNTTDKEYQFFLSVIFPDSLLRIMAYNRAVKDLNRNTVDEFLRRIDVHFTVEKVSFNDGKYGFKPTQKKQIGMYLHNQWYLLKAKKSIISDDPVKSLDVSILQDFILSPILGIENPRTDKRIDFIGGIKGTDILKDMVDTKDFAVTFSMYPTSMEELFAVADSNNLMPPKSTWFEPKLRSGMVLHNLD